MMRPGKVIRPISCIRFSVLENARLHDSWKRRCLVGGTHLSLVLPESWRRHDDVMFCHTIQPEKYLHLIPSRKMGVILAGCKVHCAASALASFYSVKWK